MATLWTSDQLARFANEGEGHFHEECPCLVDRIALPIVNGTDLYTLPDELVNIRRITYRGIRILPISHRSMRRYFDGINPTGTPSNYIYNDQGELTIKLFPTPAETIVPVQANLFSQAVIQAQCIVEYYRMPDGDAWKLPAFMRRRLIKCFVLKKAFSVEGKGQNMKAVSYFSKKWKWMLEQYTGCLQDLINSPRKLIASNLDYDLAKKLMIPRPVLPINVIGLDVDPEDDMGY